MGNGLPNRLGILALAMFILSLLAAPAYAPPLGPPASEPIWATVNATAQGNYPGGNELFTVFVVNSAQQRTLNESIDNATLTAPLGGDCCSNFGAGLPTTLTPGQSILLTIYLQIPTNFSKPTFTANLIIHATLLNGTKHVATTLTGAADVNVLGLPSGSTSQTQTTSQTGGQTSTISPTLLAAGVAIPSIIALVLLVMLIRARGGSKRMGP